MFLDFHTYLPLQADMVSVSVTDSALDVRVSEQTRQQQQAVHTLPCQRLKFLAAVRDNSVKVEINQRRIIVSLIKEEERMWERLGMEKWAWVRRNENFEEEDEEKRNPVGSGSRERNDITRPLPEAAWEDEERIEEGFSSSSDSDQSYAIDEDAFLIDNEETFSEDVNTSEDI